MVVIFDSLTSVEVIRTVLWHSNFCCVRRITCSWKKMAKFPKSEGRDVHWTTDWRLLGSLCQLTTHFTTRPRPVSKWPLPPSLLLVEPDQSARGFLARTAGHIATTLPPFPPTSPPPLPRFPFPFARSRQRHLSTAFVTTYQERIQKIGVEDVFTKF